MKPLAATATDGHACAADPRTQKILVIEDNEDCRTSLRDLLQLNGYQVDMAADGTEGVEKALTDRPGIALVDINLPGLNGYEVARRLREALGDQILLIACTAYGQADYHQQALDAGFDALRVKPVDPEQLITWLRLLG
jgi:two-component system, sensor histidine kinase